MTLSASDPRHGTMNGYHNLICRCAACRRAAADWQRDYTHRRGLHRPQAVYLAERYRELVPHGTESRYNYHRCRCDECRAAASEARRRRRQAS